MHGFDSSTDEVVTFPVPKRYLPVVIQAVAKAMEAEASTVIGSDPGPAPGEVAAGGRVLINWCDQELTRKLRYELGDSTAITMLDMTAERPGEWVLFQEVLQRSGKSRGKARAELGNLTRLIRRMRGINHRNFNWPVEVRYRYDGQIEYRMSSEVAETWKSSARQ